MNVAQLYAGFVTALKTYPAVAMMLINVAVILAAHLGWHVSTDQMASIAVVAAGFVGVVVHNAVIPNIRANAQTSLMATPHVAEESLPPNLLMQDPPIIRDAE